MTSSPRATACSPRPSARGGAAGVRAGDDRGRGGGGDRDRLHGRDRLAVVAEEVDELRCRGRRGVLAEVGRDAEGDGGGGVEGLRLDGPRDDASLQVGAEAHHRRDDQRGGDAETRPQ